MFGTDLVISSGATHNLSLLPGQPNEFIATGSPTLVAGTVIQLAPAETPNKWDMFTIYWKAIATIGAGGSMTVFGTTLTQDEANKQSIITAIFDGAAWVVYIDMDYSDIPVGVSGVKTHTMNTGENKTFDPAIDAQNIIITGAPVLAGSSTYNGGGTPVAGNKFFIRYEGTPTTGGNTITIFGTLLTDLQATSGNVFVFSVYNGAVWKTNVLFSDTYRVKGSSTDATPAYLDTKVEKSITVVADKLGLVNDVLAPGVDKYYGTDPTGAKGFFSLPTYHEVDLDIAHADILTLNATPIEIVGNPGVGKAIKVVDCAISIKGAAGVVVPYITNTTIRLITDTATIPQWYELNILLSTIDRTHGNPNGLSGLTLTTDTQVVSNKGLYVTIETANPGGGAAGQILSVHLVYRIVTIT
jgi:hypothetical protein